MRTIFAVMMFSTNIPRLYQSAHPCQGWLKVHFNVWNHTFEYEKIELLVCIYEIPRELVFIKGISGHSGLSNPFMSLHVFQQGTIKQIIWWNIFGKILKFAPVLVWLKALVRIHNLFQECLMFWFFRSDETHLTLHNSLL